MNPVKIAAIILIISAGLVGSYFIIKKGSPPISDKEDISPLNETNSLFQKPIQRVEELKDFVAKQEEEPQNPALEDSLNLTKIVAGSLFERMKNLDQGSRNPFEAQSFDINNPENQKLIEEAMVNIQDPASFFNQSIDEKDLKVSNDNSFEAKSRYINNMADVIVERDPLKTLGGVIGTFNFFKLKEVADGYKRIINAFVNIAVPSEWLEHHKRFISVLKKQEAIYQGIANLQEDPAKAALFTQMAPQVLEEEMSVRKEFFENYLGLR